MLHKFHLALATLLLGAVLPAAAGNYAEGDPRPGAQPGQLSMAQVQAD